MSSETSSNAKLEERTQNQQSSIDKMADAVMELSGNVKVLTSKVDDMREAQKGYLSRREFENFQTTTRRDHEDMRRDVDNLADNKAEKSTVDRLWTMFWGLGSAIVLMGIAAIFYIGTGGVTV